VKPLKIGDFQGQQVYLPEGKGQTFKWDSIAKARIPLDN
jgi:hypothetical protein